MHSTGYILSLAISPHPPPQQLLHHLILSPTQHNSSETEQIKWSTNFCSHLYDSSSVLCCLVSDGRRGGVSNAAVSDAIWTRHSICFVLQSSACPPVFDISNSLPGADAGHNQDLDLGLDHPEHHQADDDRVCHVIRPQSISCPPAPHFLCSLISPR